MTPEGMTPEAVARRKAFVASLRREVSEFSERHPGMLLREISEKQCSLDESWERDAKVEGSK